jgi:hypothetical protein
MEGMEKGEVAYEIINKSMQYSMNLEVFKKHKKN